MEKLLELFDFQVPQLFYIKSISIMNSLLPDAKRDKIHNNIDYYYHSATNESKPHATFSYEMKHTPHFHFQREFSSSSTQQTRRREI